MNINEIVAGYATRNAKGEVEVNLKALARDKDFRDEVIKDIRKILESEEHKNALVVIPAFQSGAQDNHLGKLINEIAEQVRPKGLETGDVKNVGQRRRLPQEVIIIKQSFRTGTGLQKQIATLRELGVQKITVRCIITHATNRMQGFGYENNVDINALVKTDEVRLV